MNVLIEDSQYYPILKEADPDLTTEKFKEVFLTYGHNPLFNQDYYSDAVFSLVRDYLVDCSLKMEKEGINIINCTEGGSLHGAINKYE